MREINLSKDREIVNCDLCGSNNFKLWDKKEPRIVKCNSCDLVYQNDRPVYKVLENFYGLSYVKNRKIEENGKRYRDRLKMYDIEINDIIKELTKRYKNFQNKNLSFLDVGAGDGGFLQALPNYFEKFGVEFNKEVISLTKQHAKKVWCGDFCNGLDFGDKKFDIIHIRGTIEHLPSPHKFFKRSWNLLSENGMLIISTIPNVNSITAKVYKRRWRLNLMDEHIYHFSKKTINKYLIKYNFKMTFCNYPYFKTPYVSFLKDNFNFFKNYFQKNKKSPSYIGSVMNIIAMKKESNEEV